ncbi:hypothetical protein [Hymenobacter aerophilus]|uniref:hypothetical protein n=1 Tax=Hymenobacter aerophilus TaxID=119644 RepID=UPI0012F9AD2E|nr:hypothetical protein [Hymenobacter aerophilus]
MFYSQLVEVPITITGTEGQECVNACNTRARCHLSISTFSPDFRSKKLTSLTKILKNMAGKFIFRRNLDIGSLEAETDSFLIETFTDKGDFEVLRDTQNGRCILIGRTGSGKSALLRYLEDQEDNVTRINPEAMSLKYLSNSDIINYLKALGTNLDLFYKVLWKHVFIIEFLKMHTENDSYKQRGFLTMLSDKYSLNKKKKEALEYLKKI